MSKIEITGRDMARPYTHGTACQCDDCTAKREEPTRTIRPALTVTLEGDTLVFASPAAEHLAAERIRDAAPALLAAIAKATD